MNHRAGMKPAAQKTCCLEKHILNFSLTVFLALPFLFPFSHVEPPSPSFITRTTSLLKGFQNQQSGKLKTCWSNIRVPRTQKFRLFRPVVVNIFRVTTSVTLTSALVPCFIIRHSFVAEEAQITAQLPLDCNITILCKQRQDLKAQWTSFCFLRSTFRIWVTDQNPSFSFSNFVDLVK